MPGSCGEGQRKGGSLGGVDPDVGTPFLGERGPAWGHELSREVETVRPMRGRVNRLCAPTLRGPAGTLTAILCVLTVQPLQAQDGPFAVGFSALISPKLPTEIEGDPCGPGTGLGLAPKLSWIVSPWLRLESDFVGVVEAFVDTCDFAPLGPGARYREESIDVPFGLWTGRIAIELPIERGAARAFAGGGFLFGTGRPVRLLGAGYRLRSRAPEISVDIERWWFKAPVEHFEILEENLIRSLGTEELEARVTSVRLTLQWRLGG